MTASTQTASPREYFLAAQVTFATPNGTTIVSVNFKTDQPVLLPIGGMYIHYFDEMLLIYNHALAANTPYFLYQYRWIWGYPGDTSPSKNQLMPRTWAQFEEAVLEHIVKPMADLLAGDLRMDITASLFRLGEQTPDWKYCSTAHEEVE